MAFFLVFFDTHDISLNHATKVSLFFSAPLNCFAIFSDIYAEVDLNMKARALACCELEEDVTPTHWRDNKGLMNFLSSI